MHCCSPIFCPPAPNPFANIDAPLPDAATWFNNPELADIRLNRSKLSNGNTDTGTSGAVELVQLALRHWGINAKNRRSLLLPDFGADGAFGGESCTAASTFQSECYDEFGNPLLRDSVVGHKTLSALDRLLFADDPRSPTTKPKLIHVKVDFVHFPDGFRTDVVEGFLSAANAMYNKIGIRICKGNTIDQHAAGPAACDIFKKNLGIPHKRGKFGTWCRSRLSVSSINEKNTAELDRLLSFRREGKDRITTYFTDSFPGGAHSPWGRAAVPRDGQFGFGIIMANSHSTDPKETFWHELGHCLLNTGYGDVVDGKEKDHSHDFMFRPVPKSRKISSAVGEHMRHVANKVLR